MTQCNIYAKFIECLTNTLRIWTFRCNFPYIRHFYVELPNNIAIKLRMNSNQSEIWFSAIFTPNLLSVWQIHFEFEHFNATVPISVISMKNYQISLQLNFKLSWSISIWIQCNISTKFTRRLTNTPRIWTFHCSFPYISHFHLDLPNNIATKLQMNSDQSEIWFSEYLHQIYWVFDKYTSNLNISMQMYL